MKSSCALTVYRGVAGHQNKSQQAYSSKQGSPCQAKGVQHSGCCAGTAASILGWTDQSTPALNYSRLATLGTFRSVQRVDCVCGELGEGLLKRSCFLRFFTRFLQVEVHLSLLLNANWVRGVSQCELQESCTCQVARLGRLWCSSSLS